MEQENLNNIPSSLINDGLILHYDFTNRVGISTNLIVDAVNNVEATLHGIAHNSSTDGYLNNKGLLLQKDDYIRIPTNTSPLNKLIDLNKGLTIQMLSYDTNGSHWKTEDGKFTAAKSGAYLRYNKLDGSEGLKYFDSYWFVDSKGNKKSYLDSVNSIGSNALNTFTMRLNLDKSVSLFINDSINESQKIPVPADLVSYINSMTVSPLLLRKDFVAHNSSSETLVAFVVYNRPLTNEEVRSNHNYYRSKETLVGISVNPSSVQLKVGESQILSVQASPTRYTNLLNINFQSGNEGFVTVDEYGVLTGVLEGETNVSIKATYNGQSFTEYVTVKVGDQVITPPTSLRIIDGISINRKTKIINVGESFVLMATALSSSLPYDIFNDNIVIWESFNPSVARVQYGVLEGVSEGTTTLIAYDPTKKYSKSFDIKVIKPLENLITPEETYIVPAEQFAIKLDNTDSINTTIGIQKALDFASINKYKKVSFPFGTYLVNPKVRTIYPPSGMVIDFNDSIINIEPSELTTKGYSMFCFNNLINTKMVRAHIYGERDSTTVNNSVENCLSILVEDCINTGFESCTFSKSPGFNFLTRAKLNTNMGKVTKSISILRDKFEIGNIDERGNLDNSFKENYYRYNQFMDITELGDYYSIGYTQGYHGYPHLRSRLYSIHFYDNNYVHIGSQMYNLQYYNYEKPQNAKYAKIVVYQENLPTTGDPDFGNAVAFIRTLGMPRNGFIKNCTFKDNFSTGLAICGGEGWLIEGNTFSNNKGRMPGCDIDWEDGWEHSVGDILKNNTFNSPIGVIISGGSSLTAYGNTFNSSALIVWGRTQNWRIFNNVLNQKASLPSPKLSTQGDSVFARNILRDLPPYGLSTQHSTGVNYKIHDINNIFIK